MIERNSPSFPNQLKPDRSDSWAIVFGAPKGTLFLNTLCTTRHMVNQDLMDVKFYFTNMLQSWSIQKSPLSYQNSYFVKGPNRKA